MRNPTRFETVRDFGVYCLFAVLLAPALSAFGGAAARQALGQDYWVAWEQWLLGDALANLIITPAIFYWIVAARRDVRILLGESVDRRRVADGGVDPELIYAFEYQGGGTGLAESRFYAPVPFLFWAAIRFGMRGASAAIVLLACFAVAAVVHGFGLFSELSPSEKGVALQHFLLLRAAPLYLAAVLIEQKRRDEVALGESEARYREVVESQTGFVCRFLPDTTLTLVNEAYCRSCGRTREQLIGTRLLDVLPEPARVLARMWVDLAAVQGKPCDWEHQTTLPDGSISWQHWTVHAIFSPDGRLDEFQAIGHDITDRMRAEEANRNLAHASRLAVVGELTAMIAHEVNQPLCAILVMPKRPKPS